MFISVYYRAFKYAVSSIVKRPIDYLLNLLSIALVVSLLFVGILVRANVNNWLGNTNIYPQIIMYVDGSSNDADVQLMGKQINEVASGKIKNYTYISGQDGLKALGNVSIPANMKDLPSVMVVNTTISDPQELNNLSVALAKIPMVDNIDIDMHYADKVNQFVTIVKNVASVVIGSSVFILFLILYNTIRVQMLFRSEEINIIRLLGASTRFILRPLYIYSLIQVIIAIAIAYAASFVLIHQSNAVLSKFNYLTDGFTLDGISLFTLIKISISLLIASICAVFVAVNLLFTQES